MEKLKKMKNLFLNALFPKDITCTNCGAELIEETRYNFCSKCMCELPFVGNHKCKICGAELKNEADYCINCMNYDHFYDMNRSPLKYEGIGVSLIKRLKFGNKKYIADEFAKMLADEYIKAGYNTDIVIPVPMSINEYKQRGFNQSALLAENVAKRLNLPYNDDILIKVRDTSDQKHLKGRDRRDNLKNVFHVAYKEKAKGKNVLLIDDVFTTGATINECGRMLKKARVSGVYSLTCCITQFKLHGETADKTKAKTADMKK